MAPAVPLHTVVLDGARDVLCELRGNRRFGYNPALAFLSSPAAPAEHPLVADVKRLRDVVRGSHTASAPLPPDALAAALDPFLRIVTSRDTSGNITGVALHALDRVAAAMLALPPARLPAYASVLSAVVSAAAGCRFDASDPAKDEVVLSRIAAVVRRVATDPRAVVLLSDAALLQGVAACLDIAFDRRRTSDLLKRCADAALVDTAAAMASHIPAAFAEAGGDATAGAAAATMDTAFPGGSTAADTAAVAVPTTTATAAASDQQPDSALPSSGRDAADPSDIYALLSFESSPDASLSSRSIDAYLSGRNLGPPFDIDAHAARGPASTEALAALLELACKLADPATPRPAAARMLGLQLVSAVLTAGGDTLRRHAVLRRLLTRECSRAILRAVGTFTEPPSYTSAAFGTATHLVYALGPDATAFLTALLGKVFPYYISGYAGVAPKLATLDEVLHYLPESSTFSGTLGATANRDSFSAQGASGERIVSGGDGGGGGGAGGGGGGGGGSGGGGGGGSGNGGGVAGQPSGNLSDGEGDGDGASAGSEIDPVVREVGLEALSSLVATQGLLASVYQVTDCSLGSGDVVTTLLLALGGATSSRAFRRRSKRLRASTGGSLSAAPGGADDDDDEEEEDERPGVSSAASGRARRARVSALLCADSLMSVVDAISERLRQRNEERSNGGLDTGRSRVAESAFSPRSAEFVAELRAVRVKKRKLMVTTEAFNDRSFSAKNATKVLTLLRQHGQVDAPPVASSNVEGDRAADVAAIVRFLRESPGLDKQKVGVVLGEPDALSQAVLKAYTGTFEFADRAFTECLRIFLESFRLPGESQKIDRIVQCFGERYESQNRLPSEDAAQDVADGDGSVSPSLSSRTKGAPGDNSQRTGDEARVAELGRSVDRRRQSPRGVFANADAVFLLSFAVVMLNSDQHNPSIRKKMTVDDFVKNCRGGNDKKDFPRWFLAEVFESIKAVEIRMSDEAGIGALTDLHWDEQLRDMARNKRSLPRASDVSVLDEDVFSACWGSCISAALVVLDEASEAGVVEKALEGLLNVARCGASFRRCEPTDAVISVLADATSVREGPLFGAAVRFGVDIKAQMASVALSNVARECGDWMRVQGWNALVAFILRLHALGLLPDAMEDSLGGYGPDFTCPDGSPLSESTLTPTWWPSQQLKLAENERNTRETAPAAKSEPKKQKMNGFFALIAASIGADSLSDDEYDSDDEIYHDVPPAYLKLRSAEDREAEELARRSIAGCRLDEILINEAKVLRSNALSCLATGLAQAANEVLDGGAARSQEVQGSSNWTRSNDPSSSGAGTSVGGKERDNSALTSGNTPSSNGAGPPTGAVERSARATGVRDSSVIAGTARVVRNSGSSIESDVDALIGYSGTSYWNGAVRARDEEKARASVVAFCIDALCELTVQNRDRLSIPWPALHGILLRVIDRNTRSVALLERAVVALLRVADRLLHRDEIHSDVLRGLNLIVNLPSKTVEELSLPVSAGVYNLVKTHSTRISSVSGWHALLSIIENCARYHPPARNISFQALSFLLTDDKSFEAVSAETYAPLLEAVLAYTACMSVEASMNALKLLSFLSERIPKLAANVARSAESAGAQGGTDREWAEYWGPLLRGFATASRDARGKVRNTALTVLERVVSVDGAASQLSPSQWHQAMTSVLLPLMEELFSSRGLLRATIDAERAAQKQKLADQNAEAAASAPRGRGARNAVATPAYESQLVQSVKSACDKTRLLAVMLISKTFLQHHARMAEGLTEATFTECWLGVLNAFKSALVGGRGERGAGESAVDQELRERVPESIKNILLVLSASGLLDQSETSERWKATFVLLQDCLPQLELEEFVVRATKPPTPVPAARPASILEGNEAETAATGDESVSENAPGGEEGPAPAAPVVAASPCEVPDVSTVSGIEEDEAPAPSISAASPLLEGERA